MHSPQAEDFHKIRVYLWRTWVLPLKNMGVPLKNFMEIKAPPPNSIYIYSYSSYKKKSSIVKTYPWRIPWRGEEGGTSYWIREPITIPKSYKIMYINSGLICRELCWVLQNYKVLQMLLFYLPWFCFGVRGVVCTDPVGSLSSTAIIMIAFLERLPLADVIIGYSAKREGIS